MYVKHISNMFKHNKLVIFCAIITKYCSFVQRLLIEDDENKIASRISLSYEKNKKYYSDSFLNMFPIRSIQDVLDSHKVIILSNFP